MTYFFTLQTYFHTVFFKSEILCLRTCSKEWRTPKCFQQIPKRPFPIPLLICSIQFYFKFHQQSLVLDRCRCLLILKILVEVDMEAVTLQVPRFSERLRDHFLHLQKGHFPFVYLFDYLYFCFSFYSYCWSVQNIFLFCHLLFIDVQLVLMPDF